MPGGFCVEKDFNSCGNNNEKEKIEVKARECSGSIRPWNFGFSFVNGKEKIKDKKYKLRRFLWAFATFILLLIIFYTALFFSCVGRGDVNLNFLFGRNKEIVADTASAQLPSADVVVSSAAKKGDELTAVAIYEKVSPAIVGVITSNKELGLGNAVGQGTGIVMTNDGYILTNAHVIGFSKSNNVTVALNEKEYSAKVIGFDARVDIAVLKIDAKNLKCAEFGNSDNIRPGEDIIAIGNPFGMELSKTLTKGVVSATDRNLGDKNKKNAVKFIQLDAALNHGNSGGAVINTSGQVIGISSIKIADISKSPEGLGFAIPINVALDTANKIIKHGYSTGNVKLGINAKNITKWESQFYDVPPGVLITSIAEGSSLTSSGIKAGDIITKMDGVTVLSTEGLKEELMEHKPGDIINLTVFRKNHAMRENGTTIEAKVTLLESNGKT